LKGSPRIHELFVKLHNVSLSAVEDEINFRFDNSTSLSVAENHQIGLLMEYI